jgi:hypothetical protein
MTRAEIREESRRVKEERMQMYDESQQRHEIAMRLPRLLDSRQLTELVERVEMGIYKSTEN